MVVSTKSNNNDGAHHLMTVPPSAPFPTEFSSAYLLGMTCVTPLFRRPLTEQVSSFSIFPDENPPSLVRA